MSRTKAQKAVAKKLLTKPAGELLPIDLTTAKSVPRGMTRAFSNNRLVIMIFDNESINFLGDRINAIKVMVQRHDDKPIPNHWRELQNIKNKIFGNDATAIEFFPPESELVDVANIYWFWVIDWLKTEE